MSQEDAQANKVIYTKSTSLKTAQVSEIELRNTGKIRLIFRPMIIENQNNIDASVKGVFLYQKKSINDEWEDFDTISLSSVKKGEGYKLEIKSAELLKLTSELKELYDLYRVDGVPRGNKSYVQVTPQLELLNKLSNNEISTFLNTNVAIGAALLTKLLNWATKLNDPAPFIDRLVELETTSLSKLNVAIGLQSLKKALAIWEENKGNPDEEFWQNSLTNHSYVLEQVFSWPASIVKGKAYIGGKNMFNKEGNIVDFLTRNKLTNSAALIEIKTPMTELLGGAYRNTYNISKELSGSIMQTLNYKHSLQENFLSLKSNQDILLDSLNPQCAVIIGNFTEELNDKTKVRAFELYRHQFPGLSVITFDELYEKTKNLIALLEGPKEVYDITF